MPEKKGKQIGYWEVVSIGVGGMVGGGIFAVLGLAVQLAHGGTPVAFLLAGLVALITSYSYAKLSVRFPSRGGTVIFLDKAFGVDVLTGSVNNLLWLSYMVMLALYAYAFGSYGATFFPPDQQALLRRVLINAGIILPTILNLFNAEVIGKAEDYIVGLKILILLFFVGIGFQGVEVQRLMPQAWSPPLHLVAGGMIIFIAYEGFELIANTAEEVERQAVNLPRAFYSAVLFVILLYVGVSTVAVGALPISKIVAAKDYALAEAAKPFLGSMGFQLISAAALLSTLSAINATLYGAGRLSFIIAKEGELPAFLEKKVWNRPVEGLLITSLLSLALVNLGDLSSISTMGSAGFLIVFASVNGANISLCSETQSRKWLPWVGLIACVFALLALLWQSFETSPKHILVLAVMVGLSFLVELSYKLFWDRKLRLNV